nr:hypothetical protein [Tanacetum cinerariifolium]
MNPQETQQVDARDKKRVSFTERVKISSTNVRLETTVPQKEETFQVVIDLIKNSKCFKAFTISTDVPKIFMTILNIYPRVEGVDFTDVPDDDATLSFLIKLGYKGPLYKHTNIENVDYRKLIWEDLAFQIDHGKEKISRRENMPFLPFTKVIINYFLKQHNSLSNLKYQHCHTIKDDGIVSRCSSNTLLVKFLPRRAEIKGHKGKKKTDTHVVDVDKSEESDLKPPKRKTASRRVVKKKVTITADDKIIPDDPDVALKLCKSISKAEAKEAKAARQVHATHARIVTESVPKPTRGRKSGKLTFDPPKRIKGVPSVTLEEQEAVDTMKTLKESRKTNRSQPGTGGLNKETSTIPGVLDESIVISATLKEDLLDDEEKDDKDGDADDEGDDHIIDTQDANDEDAETESDVDEIYKYKIHVHKDMDAEMAETKTVENQNKEKDVITNAAKPDIQSLSVQKFPISVILKTTNLPPIPEILIETLVSTAISSPHVTPAISTVQQTSTPIPTPPITTEFPTSTTVVPESDALSAVQLRTSTVDLEQEYEKSPSKILKIKMKQAEKQKMLKFTINFTDNAALKEFDQKSTLYQTMHANKSFNRNFANHRLYHTPMEALIEDENAMDKGVDDTIKDHKRKQDDEEDGDDKDPSARPNQGNKTKRRRNKESESSKKPSTTKENLKVVMDDVGKNVVHDDDQPQDTSEPNTAKNLNPEWFTKPPRPPTLDPEWNKH